MTISNELFLAVLAMDAYNRDYNKGVIVDGNQVGNATLGLNSSILTGADNERLDQPVSFFAQAYTLPDGQTVIAYRGMDQPTLAAHVFFLSPQTGEVKAARNSDYAALHPGDAGLAG